MAQFQIYHSIGENMLKHVGFVEANSLEQAFQYSQNDHDDWHYYEARSTSVGDIIQSEDGFYMVRGMGFKFLG